MNSWIVWQENGAEHHARWQSAAGIAVPKRVVIADDQISADKAYHLACEGTSLLWRGDFQNCKQLLQALARRFDKSKKSNDKDKISAEAFHLYRMGQAQRARTLGMLLIPFEADHSIPLRRAPDVRDACMEAMGTATKPYVASLRELLGIIGAHEWRRNGIEVSALGAGLRIHPHYGVFAPIRSEYVDLVAQTPLPQTDLAFDIGTGTGVLAAVIAKRGLQRVIATECDARALACARDNILQLGLTAQVEITETTAGNLFPPLTSGRAGLVVCNPPWLPGKPASPLEHAIYDPESRMLKGLLADLGTYLTADGEGWLILSDLAEHVGLRTRAELLGWIEAAGLRVLGQLDARPRHSKAFDANDPLHAARRVEITSLWRLGVRSLH